MVDWVGSFISFAVILLIADTYIYTDNCHLRMRVFERTHIGFLERRCLPKIIGRCQIKEHHFPKMHLCLARGSDSHDYGSDDFTIISNSTDFAVQPSPSGNRRLHDCWINCVGWTDVYTLPECLKIRTECVPDLRTYFCSKQACCIEGWMAKYYGKAQVSPIYCSVTGQ